LPSDQKLLIDRLCSRFEAALKAVQPSQRLRLCLKKLPASIADGGSRRTVLPLEADYRQREGNATHAAGAGAAFPGLSILPGWPNVSASQASETGLGGSSMPEEPETPVPQRLGDYRIVRRLGFGGMGTVYRAVHERMGREVAVKLLRPEIQRNPLCCSASIREVRAAAKLSHPNIVAALDAREHDGLHFLVTELVAGRDLDQTVRLTVAHCRSLTR
jgi:hypothetical protein